MTQHEYTLVTVAHKLDQPLLELQAVSLARHLNHSREFPASIVVIDNSQPGRLDRIALLKKYEQLAARVRFMELAEFGELPSTSGWHRQQVLKLLISRRIATRRYVVLDAKNHLTGKLSRELFESKNGLLMRSYLQSFRQHPHHVYVENACRYFGIDPLVIDSFMPIVTPYPMSTHVVRDLLDYVEHRENRTFARAFLIRPKRHRLTEFTLYAAYLIQAGQLSTMYDFDGAECPIIWEHYDTPKVCATLLGANTHPIFAVHRSAFPILDREATEALVRLWHGRRLFSSQSAARAFISACAERYGSAPCVGR